MQMLESLKRNSIRWLALAGLLLALVIALPFIGTKDAQAGSFEVASGYSVKSLSSTAHSVTVTVGHTGTSAIGSRKCKHTATEHEECNGYNFRIRNAAEGSTWSSWHKVAAPYSNNRMDDRTHTFNNLEDGTRYKVEFKVRGSHHGHHHTGGGEHKYQTTLIAVPDAPTDFSAEHGPGQIALSWTAPANTNYIDYWEMYRVQGFSIDTSNLDDALWERLPISGATTQYVDQGLPDGLPHARTHTYLLRGVNTVLPEDPDAEGAITQGGVGAWSSPVSEPTTSEAWSRHVTPGRVGNPAARAGDERIYLSWSQPTNLGPKAIDSWQVRHRRGNGSWGDNWQDVSGVTFDRSTRLWNYTVKGLRNGSEYTLEIRARNVRTGQPSGFVRTTPAREKPGRPRDFAVVGGDQKATLTWNPPANTDSFTEWQVYHYKTWGDPGDPDPSWTTIPEDEISIDANGQYTWVVRGLKNGEEWRFKIRARNTEGSGSSSGEVADWVRLAAPQPPTNFTANPGDLALNLSWTPPLTGQITRYEYQTGVIQTDPRTGRKLRVVSEWTLLTDNGRATSAVVTGLTNGADYSIKIRAVNSEGDGAPAIIRSATPRLAAPPAPADLTAQVRRIGTVTLAWTPPTTGAITKYQYFTTRSADDPISELRWRDLTADGAATRADVTGLTNGETYAFRIRAVNGAGTGAASDPVTITLPVPNAPTNLSVAVGDQELAVGWTASVANDCPVTGYEIDLMRVEASADGDTFHVVTSGRSIGTTKAFGELAADTRYQVTVTAWSEDCGIGSGTLQGIYTTNAADAPDDPTVPAAKTDPGAPTNVVIARYGDDVQVSWDAPASADNICAVSWYDLRFMREGGEWLNSIQSFPIQLFGDQYVAGGEYTAEVYAYSWECDQWSLKTQATQTLQ